MNRECFLIFTQSGIDRMTKTLPARLGAGQFAIRVELNVPDRFFAQPIPSVQLEIPESATLGPPVTVDLASMDEVCTCETFVALPADHSENYRCAECGYETWKNDPGPHYVPAPEVDP